MQQQLKGKDDSDVVLLYNINYIIPLQEDGRVAGKLKLEGRSEPLRPCLSSCWAIRSNSRRRSSRRTRSSSRKSKVFGALNGFLCPGLKYEVKRYVDVKQISDKAFTAGCEFGGRRGPTVVTRA